MSPILVFLKSGTAFSPWPSGPILLLAGHFPPPHTRKMRYYTHSMSMEATGKSTAYTRK